MNYNFTFLNELGPQWNVVVNNLEDSQSNLDFDYKQAIDTSYRCIYQVIDMLLFEFKLQRKENIEENLNQLVQLNCISEALSSRLQYIVNMNNKSKYQLNEIIAREEAEKCLNNVYDLLVWYANTKCKKKECEDIEFDFLPERFGNIKELLNKAKESLEVDPENTLIKCRKSMEIIVEDIANKEKIYIKSKTLYDSIEGIKEILPDDIYHMMQSTRVLGNIGGHKNDFDIDKLKIDARACFEITYRILYWFSNYYKPSKKKKTPVISDKPSKKNDTPVISDKPTKVFSQSWGTSGEYTGIVLNGKRHGKGRMLYINGDIYDGYWDNDKRHGKGRMMYVSGTIYEGEWKNNYKHGKVENYKNEFGSIYKGDIKKGKFNGYGVMKYSNGDVYSGMWKDNKMHGEGKFVLVDGKEYIGTFKDGNYQEPENIEVLDCNKDQGNDINQNTNRNQGIDRNKDIDRNKGIDRNQTSDINQGCDIEEFSKTKQEGLIGKLRKKFNTILGK